MSTTISQLTRPNTIEQYARWMNDVHAIGPIDQLKNHYNSVCSEAHNQISRSNFWTTLVRELDSFSIRYKAERGAELLNNLRPKIQKKTFESFFNKTFRHNVLKNEAWPDAPLESGWALPPTWHSLFTDLLRTSIPVFYLDGVRYLEERICELANVTGDAISTDCQARMEGYYAIQLNSKFAVDVPSRTFETEKIDFGFEIQITTETKKMVAEILHHFYRRNRLAPNVETSSRFWNSKDDEFQTIYLGHMLQYLEGVIVDLRDKCLSEDGKR